MGEWKLQAFVGVAGGLAVFVVVFVPVVVWHYRRYGRVSLARLLGAAGLSVYTVALVAYTFLPLPAIDIACASGGAPSQWRPLAFLSDIERDVSENGARAILTGRATLQVAFNVLLFIPLGVIARRFWSRGVLGSMVIGLMVSLIIESTQLTGIWGLYPCAFRVADVDDLLANTLGALIGSLVAPALLWWMPSRRELRARREDARPVHTVRRWIGMLLDVVFFIVVSTLLSGCLAVVHYAVAGRLEISAIEDALATIVVGFLVVVVPAMIGTGASVGQRIVWLTPHWPGRDRGTLGRRLARSALTGGVCTTAIALAAVADESSTLGILLLLSIYVGAVVVAVPLTRGRRGLSGVLTGADVIDARAIGARTHEPE